MFLLLNSISYRQLQLYSNPQIARFIKHIPYQEFSFIPASSSEEKKS